MGRKKRVYKKDFFARLWMRLNDFVTHGWVVGERTCEPFAPTGLSETFFEALRKIVHSNQWL